MKPFIGGCIVIGSSILLSIGEMIAIFYGNRELRLILNLAGYAVLFIGLAVFGVMAAKERREAGKHTKALRVWEKPKPWPIRFWKWLWSYD